MNTEQDEWLAGIGVDVNQVLQLKNQAESSVASQLQSMQNSALTAVGASPETIQDINTVQQGIADFDRGRDQGRASGSAGLISMLPPVQLAQAVGRISDAEDPEAEAMKIAQEKVNTMAAIGKVVADPVESGSAFGKSLGGDAAKARDEGRLAEFSGNLAGHGDVIAATVAVGGGLAGAGEGAAVSAGEGGFVAAGEEGAISINPLGKTLPTPALVDGGAVVAADEGALALSPAANSGPIPIAVVADEGAVALSPAANSGPFPVAAVADEGALAVSPAANSGPLPAVADGGFAAAGDEGAVVVRTAEGADAAAPTSRAPAVGDPVASPDLPPDGTPPTLESPDGFGLGRDPISPQANSVAGSQVGKPVPLEGPPTQLPPAEEPIPPTLPSTPDQLSAAAESVPIPDVG